MVDIKAVANGGNNLHNDSTVHVNVPDGLKHKDPDAVMLHAVKVIEPTNNALNSEPIMEVDTTG